MTTTPTGAGTLGIGTDGTFRIRFDRVLAHPVDRVWAALTDPEKLGVWLPAAASSRASGARSVTTSATRGPRRARWSRCVSPSASDPTAELEHTWCWDDLPVSVVTWRLEPSGAGTWLYLTHREVVREPATEFTIGWHAILDTLDRYADGRSWDDVWDGYDLLHAYYASA